MLLGFAAVGCVGESATQQADAGINPCQAVTCSHRGVCAASGGGAVCICDSGYHAQGTSCEADDSRDPCTGVDCGPGGECAVASSAARCLCGTGYHSAGPTTCVPDGDPCAGVACSAHGICAVAAGSAACICSAGYHAQGLTCLQNADPCSGVTCSGHGTCSASGGAASCTCAAGYHAQGLTCIQDSAGDGYHVGPAQPYTTIGAVPWYSLKAGDTVYIHWQETAYREKFLISGQGTASQWIRVLGVPGPHGELPVISGDNATTGKTMHHRWQDASGNAAIQNQGIVQVAAGESNALPAYIEIGGLEIRDAGGAYRFTAENGSGAAYDAFASCIYARSAHHLLIHDNVLHNCGNGFYNWIGSGAAPDTWWDGLQIDTVLRGNHFYDNGAVGNWSMHQTYTESDRVIIENNHYGPMKAGALGSQLKDRSAGTIIRYNDIEGSPEGWDLDLVEPENSWSEDCSQGENPNGLNCRPYYAHDFVYGNVIVNPCSRASCNPNFVHWNEDHYAGHGRATRSEGRLSFYDNTVVLLADEGDLWGGVSLFNAEYGGYDCPGGPLPGVIDVRNNLLASLPRTSGAGVPLNFGYCGLENVSLGVNWISPGWSGLRSGAPHSSGSVTGAADAVSPAGNDPGFIDAVSHDFHLEATSSAARIGGALGPEVTSNPLDLDLTPTQQYAPDHGVVPRAQSGVGSDVGAFER